MVYGLNCRHTIYRGKIMTKKIAIPVEDASGTEAKVAQHFGQAPYFAIVDLNGENINVEIQRNTGEHAGGTGHPHENLLVLKPNVIIAYAMGPGGLQSFQSAGISVLKAEGNTVKEVIENFKAGKLKELTGGCPHAHEHHHTH
jgi:predicted Fe-Mo cluster-binding NifX family protein